MLVTRFGFGFIVVLAGADMAAAQEQDVRNPGRSIAWQAKHDEGTPYSIKGRIQTFDGRPISHAAVSLVGARVGARPDANGYFEMIAPGPGDWEIRIIATDFREARETVTIVGFRRVEVVAVLSEYYDEFICGLRICVGRHTDACKDLRIEVVDSTTGRPPDATVTIRLEHESGIERNVERLSSDNQPGQSIVGLGKRVETVGYHTIEVTAPGYRRWRLKDVWLELMHDCQLRGGDHVARLVPTSSQPSHRD